MKRRRFIKKGALWLTGAAGFGIFMPNASGSRRHSLIARGAPTGGAGGGCSTLSFDRSGAPYDGDTGYSAFYTYVASKFTSGATFTACKGELRLLKQNTPTGTLQLKIYTDNSGNPGTLVGSGSSTINMADVSSDAYYTFASLSASLTSSTVYWAVMQASAAPNDIKWIGQTGSDNLRGSTDGSSWDNIGNLTTNFKLYS